MPHVEFGSDLITRAKHLIDLALSEDLGDRGDITAEATIPENARGAACFVARREGIVAGLPVARLVAARFGLDRAFLALTNDGASVRAGQPIAQIEGPMRALLSLERTALNFLQRLSGVATLTARFVRAIEGTNAVILDTRKTTPGWRLLEKYAVRCGGGRNHRMGLFDAILIKDNHLAWLRGTQEEDPIGRAIRLGRQAASSGTVVEIEVDSLADLERALSHSPEIILVDNLGPGDLREAVRLRDQKAPQVLLEASGGITLETVAAIARSGIDRISVGALTHSAPALDIALDYLDDPAI